MAKLAVKKNMNRSNNQLRGLMGRSDPRRQAGLILLVVLGMLTLFSMLTVTYLVFASQSRISNFGMVRSDFYGTPPAKLIDIAFRQALRGTTDTSSVWWRHSLLADVYGNGDITYGDVLGIGDNTLGRDQAITTRARIDAIPGRDNPGRNAQSFYGNSFANGTSEGPRLLGTPPQFLKIPLQWGFKDGGGSIHGYGLPEQHDALTGRVVTFLEGPLVDQSFRIIRYHGQMPAGNVAGLELFQALQYSIVIDLSNAAIPPGSTPISLCYGPTGSYSILINSAPLNSVGTGVIPEHLATPAAGIQTSGGLLHQYAGIPWAGGYVLSGSYLSVAAALTPNFSHIRKGNPAFVPYGDSDESYDAADYADFYQSFQYAGAASSNDIIPSFHRPALVNFLYGQIVASKALPAFAPLDLVSTIEILQRACGRPLAFKVTNIPGASGGNVTLSSNIGFTGSNIGDYSNVAAPQTPFLNINWANWNTEYPKFEHWVRWLMRGPWDVDNNGDGVADSIWIDINFPLMTSPEGKLLKMMAAYYIEDLGGRLNLNASSSQVQADSNFSSFAADNRFVVTGNLAQGLGAGTADISLRPLFTNDSTYYDFISSRNGGGPGTDGVNDLVSQLRERHRASFYSQNTLPGMPTDIFGRIGLGMDLMGNPLMIHPGFNNQVMDDPYEPRILHEGRHDNLVSLTEWERLYRLYDWDRSSLKSRLDTSYGISGVSTATAFSRATTPLSSSLIAARVADTYFYARFNPNGARPFVEKRRVGSFIEMVEALAQRRWTKDLATYSANYTPANPMLIPMDSMASLFPIEFRQNLPLDLNRPFGNGLDDNGNLLVDEATESARHGLDDDNDGLIDEPDEAIAFPLGHQLGEYATTTNVVEQYSQDAGLSDPVLDGLPLGDPAKLTYGGNQGRQWLARHLYCLAQLLIPDDYVFPNVGAALPYGDPNRARILAQWAVNVVDFRDADSNMTRFAYDANPFKFGTGQPPSWAPDDGVVWGLEAPELMLTESLAFHDVRIDERLNPQQGDNKWHQLRRPEGSLFLEFQSTRSFDGAANSGALPGVSARPVGHAMASSAIYNIAADGSRYLNLGGYSVDSSPLWRVLLLTPNAVPTSTYEDSFNNAATRQTTDYQPPPSQVDRVLWFANVAPAANNLGGISGQRKVFRNRTINNVYLQPGQHLVVGPRPDTYIGQRKQLFNPPKHRPSPQRITLAPDWATYSNGWCQIWNEINDPGPYRTKPFPVLSNPIPPGLLVLGSNLRGAATLVATGEVPLDWQNNIGGSAVANQVPVGLNISEPLPNSNYYRQPQYYLNEDDTALDDGDNGSGSADIDYETQADGFRNLPQGQDAYVDRKNNSTGNAPFTELLDMEPNSLLTQAGWPMNTTDPAETRPQFGTKLNWSTAVLQRLANPDLPWHADFNPYITVDWLPIDLTVFSGETDINNDFDVRLGSRQKTGFVVSPTAAATSEMPAGTPFGRTLYSYHSEPAAVSNPILASGSQQAHFNYTLPLEYIDKKDPSDTDDPRVPRFDAANQHIGRFTTLGYLNSRYGLRGLGGEPTHAFYLGAPVFYNAGVAQVPMSPYWTDRDFVSGLELLSVPMSSASQLMQQFGGDSNFLFTHLLDFDQSQNGGNKSVSDRTTLPMMLELTGTRTLWADAETALNPATVHSFVPPSVVNNDAIRNEALGIYQAPHNRLPSYVEPGKVNMNTSAEASVLRGLMWSTMSPVDRNSGGVIPFQTELSSLRVSSGSNALITGNGNPHLDMSAPTDVRVFHSSDSIDQGVMGTLLSASPLYKNGVEGGLLRSLPSAPGQRLFSATAGLPLTPMVQNQPVTRLQNLVTDRSNVFAVRVTIGFFEFDPLTGIGREYGQDEGKVRRHKGFYVVDRSIPVGFQAGQDHNTQNCVLLRRIIE
ncbi:MAG: hypothetical protein KDB03_10735 [Planctomycetales bacterium]|nr:hypothetical protein [Planctomycetales bacterium]